MTRHLELEKWTIGHSYTDELCIRLADDPDVAVAVVLDTGDKAEQQFHARLIAAAPETAAERDRLREINAELLEALEQIASSSCCETPGCSVDDPYCETMIARAAIAKATGE